ncbi:2-keto-4-pentenoate hydratase [Streptomyces sp. NPDC001978]|uniref:2-keto-4-pentenoate hydratase n=1 Tax=Streptomyces sp. NPDC001978 TaxID=3364627 RepID=UPI0036B241C5
MTIESAERLDAVLAAAKARGNHLIGYKTALLAPEAQRRLGAAGPVWGVLTDDMAINDGDEFDLSTVASAKAEVELVFQLGSDLVGPGVTEADVLAATAAVYAGIEIPSVPRGAEPPTRVGDYLACNALAAGYVLGCAVTGFHDIDMSLVGAVLEVDGDIVSSGAGAQVLGNPVRAVAWLANRLARHGKELHAGMVVFTGGLAAGVALAPGQSVAAEIAHVGRVAFRTA